MNLLLDTQLPLVSYQRVACSRKLLHYKGRFTLYTQCLKLSHATHSCTYACMYRLYICLFAINYIGFYLLF
jgi:hypothetical protein